MPAPQEFTPEVNDEFYKRLAGRIGERGVTQAGQARSEALSRGLGGDPYEASAVGLARQGTQRELGDLDASLAYNVAGLNREERIGTANREDTQQFQSEQSALDRDNQRKLAQMGFDFQGDQANTASRRGLQQALWMAPFQIAGAYAGSRGGK